MAILLLPVIINKYLFCETWRRRSSTIYTSTQTDINKPHSSGAALWLLTADTGYRQ